MPDIFDQVASQPQPQAQQQPAGDIFDLVASQPTPQLPPPIASPGIIGKLADTFFGPNTAAANAPPPQSFNPLKMVDPWDLVAPGAHQSLFGQGSDKPIADLTQLHAENLVPGSGTASKIGRGAVEGGEGFFSGLTSPQQIALMSAIPGLGKVPVIGKALSRLVSGLFSADMIVGVAEQSPEFVHYLQKGDAEGAARVASSMTLGSYLAYKSGKHARYGDPAAAPEPPPGFSAEPIEFPPAGPTAAPAAPEAPVPTPAAPAVPAADRYAEALAHVQELGKASTSTLQRKFKIGYGEASRYLDRMEQEGIIGPKDGSKPRPVLPQKPPLPSETVPTPEAAELQANENARTIVDALMPTPAPIPEIAPEVPAELPQIPPNPAGVSLETPQPAPVTPELQQEIPNAPTVAEQPQPVETGQPEASPEVEAPGSSGTGPTLTTQPGGEQPAAVAADAEGTGQAVAPPKPNDYFKSYDWAVEIVRSARRASTATLKLRLGIPIEEVNRYVDRMLKEGIIGPRPEPGKPYPLLKQAEARTDKHPWEMTADEFIESKGIKAGRREIQQAHNEHSAAVHAAAEAGKPVPPEVLKEYPAAAIKMPKPKPPTQEEVNAKADADGKAALDKFRAGNENAVYLGGFRNDADGVESFVHKTKRGYQATLWDTDAGKHIGVTNVFDTHAKAIESAKKMAGDGAVKVKVPAAGTPKPETAIATPAAQPPAPVTAEASRGAEALAWAKAERMEGRRTNIPQLMQNFGLDRAEATRIFDQSIEETSEKAPIPSEPSETKDTKAGGAPALVHAIYQKLKGNESLGNVTELTKLAEEHFGSSRTSGLWTPKDMFDAMEAGVNKHLIDRGKELLSMDGEKGLAELRDLMKRLTTQGVRTDEQIKAQQFSTPPTESYVAAKVANLKPDDVVLEPSAGNGGLAVWPKSIGAEVHVNEIAPRRREMLKEAGFDEPTDHDGEYINAHLDPEIKPTVILMNPPFSAATLTKGDTAKNSNVFGFNHVDQALQRLAPGGRLVVILGGGQANEPNGGAALNGGQSGKWFDKVGKQYNIRANIRVDGKEYAKYGTSFATRIIVIDKSGPNPGWRSSVVAKNVATLEEAYHALKGVEATRPAVTSRGATTTTPGRPASAPPPGKGNTGTGLGTGPKSGGPGDHEVPQTSGEAPGGVSTGDVERVRQSPTGVEQGEPEPSSQPATPGSGPTDAVTPHTDAPPPHGPESGTPGHEQTGLGSTDAEASVDDRVAIENAEHEHVSDEEDSTGYVTYQPSIKGKAHPGQIVETKTMATVPLPKLTYKPHAKVAASKWLSAVQLEAVMIAGQQNSIVLPGGARAAALIGDGTGVGKGSEAAGILWDNYLQGRKRIVMVSQNWDLMNAFMGDLNDVGAAGDLLRGLTKQPSGKWGTAKGQKGTAGVIPLNAWDADETIKHEGVVFSTYGTMRSGDKKGNRRIAQIEEYLKGNDDGEGGYILFDESHNLKNAVPGAQGEASQVGIAAKELLERVPKLRSVSLSATAASEVRNLGYLDRLGLWGPGTAFPDGFRQFQSEIADGGLAAMELIAREMKALGKYLSRTLSFKGVTYETVVHELTPEQKAIYNTAAEAWATVSQSVEATIRDTTNGGGAQSARFMSQFYGAQLRFFSILITTLKLPTAIKEANKALADDKAVVITLVNTNEAAQKREKAKMPVDEEEEDLTEFDFGPKEILKNLVEKSYPIQQYEDAIDQNGKPYKRPMYTIDPLTGKEKPLVNPQAKAERDALVKRIEDDLHLPDNPLDILINSLGGHEKVAELTGRQEYYDRATNDFIKRAGGGISHKDVNLVEAKAFQDGEKEVAVLSSAAGTGISLHAGLNVKNQKQRVHITLQVGWQADKAQQMLGRTHRTNQASAPHYVFLVSNLGGEQRFVATIQQRLESLGALSKGQKDAASSGSAAEFNPLSAEGKRAANGFYTALLLDQPVPGTGNTGLVILEQMKVLKVIDGALTVPDEDRENVARLMNRVLAMEPDLQNGVFNYFASIYQEAVKTAIERGTLDTGVKTLPGDEFTFGKPELLATDKDTGAETWYYPVTAMVKQTRASLAQLKHEFKDKKTDNPQLLVGKKGQLAFTIDANPHVTEDGKIIPARYVMKPGRATYTRRDEPEILRAATELHAWVKDQVKEADENLAIAKDELKSDEQYGYGSQKQEFRRLRDRIDTQHKELERAKAALRADEELWNRPDPGAATPAAIEARQKTKERALEIRATTVSTLETQIEASRKSWLALGDPFSEKRAKVTEAEAEAEKAAAIAKDPMAWAYKQWKEEYDASPTHLMVDHHLIGGAVMRYWNALKSAAFIRHAIFTSTETKTGKRVVGIDIPAARITQLKARISGGASMVDAGQIYTDVLRNATRYTLEGNIQVQRGSVSRTPVIQVIPPNDAVGRNLVRMGVMQERGMTPIYYVPNVVGRLKDKNGPAVKSTHDILRSILEEYPAEVAKTPNSGERGSVTLNFLTGGLIGGGGATPPAEPETQYSGLTEVWKGRMATKNKLVRNLSQIQEADPDVHIGLVTMAASRAQSGVLLRVSAPRIVAALGGQVSWLDFRRTLIESRLRGIRARWADMAEQARNASDQDLDTAMGRWMYHLLDKLHYEASDPDQTAAALLERGDYDGLRMLLEDQFERAEANTASVMTDAEYQRATSQPKYQAGLKVYKKLAEKEIAKNHAENEGVFSDALGPLDTYYPLIPITEEDGARAHQAASSAPYRKPRNMASNFATGQAKDYDPSMDAFNERIRSAFRNNNKAAVNQLMRDKGLLKITPRGEDSPETIRYQGREFVAKEVRLSEERTLITPTRTIHMPATKGVVPEWLHDEAAPILDKSNLKLYDPESLIAKITQATLAGPTDVVIHSANLIGTLVARTPFLGHSLSGKAVTSIPFAKRAAAMLKVLTTDPTTDEAARDMIHMAKIGIIPEKFATETWSKAYAELTGAKRKFTFSPLLYGPKGIDIRARLVLYRLAKEINPNITDTEAYLYVNQLGNYTRALQGEWERKLKGTMWSPFATAGMTMNRNAINTILGTGPQAKKSSWAANMLNSDALKVVALWVLAHKAYTGKWPWEEKDSKLLKIKLNPKDRNSAVGQMLGGPPKNGDVYVNIGFASPLVGRGARALGIQGAYDAKMAKGSADQVMEAALTGVINSAMSPVMGPPAKFAWLGILGTEPYLTGLKDPSGRPSPQFFPAVKPQKPGAVGFLKQHVVPPLINMNSLLANVGEATGFTDGIMRENSGAGSGWQKAGLAAFNLAAPQLVDRPVKHGAHAAFLLRQRKAESHAK